MVTDADRQAADQFWIGTFEKRQLARAFAKHREAAERAGAQAERASIAKWLRTNPRAALPLGRFTDHSMQTLADAIKRGDHEEPGPPR